MDVPECDVIGCTARAVWVLVAELDSYCERHLCHAHWSQLGCRVPDHSDSYVLLSPPAREPARTDAAAPEEPVRAAALHDDPLPPLAVVRQRAAEPREGESPSDPLPAPVRQPA